MRRDVNFHVMEAWWLSVQSFFLTSLALYRSEFLWLQEN